MQIKINLDSHLSARREAALPSLWLPPWIGRIKENFDGVNRNNFAVAAAVISDSSRNIIFAATHKLHSTNVLLVKATTTLLASQLASSTGHGSFALEVDTLLVILVVNQPNLLLS